MSLLVPWLVFPLALGALCLGCGALVARLAGVRVGIELLLPLGYGAIVVVAGFMTWVPGTASLAASVVVGLAAAGLAGSWPVHRPGRVAFAALAAAVSVFLAYGLPVLASGEPTFAGYISLDDTATWLALADRTLDEGRSLDGLAPSSYEATLATNLGGGYPFGVVLPLGIGAQLVGEDVAWVFQPYVAFVAALLALALFGLARPFVKSVWTATVVAFIAAQPALLYAYAQWSGVKEVAAACLIASACALAGIAAARSARSVLLPATAAAALAGVLSMGGLAWLAVAAALGAVLAWRRGRIARAIAAGAMTFVLALPTLETSREFLRRGEAELRSESVLGNLPRPLDPLQLGGIWPTADFRTDPDVRWLTFALIAGVAVLAAAGVVYAARRRAWEVVAYVVTSLTGVALIAAAGSPWIDAKAFATASPAILFSALAGCAWILARVGALPAVAAAGVVASGVLWSNGLAYHGVTLAPHDQLAELEAIGDSFAGQGPVLTTEYQPYAVRHFLRRLEPEGASELRRHAVTKTNGSVAEKGEAPDLDELALPGVLFYRTLVLRRSPVASRPPAPYELRWQGRWYEVWQRATTGKDVLSHVPLGDPRSPGATAMCSDVVAIARGASEIATVTRRNPVAVLAARPSGVHEAFVVPAPGRYALWLGGSRRARADVYVDGDHVASAAPHLDRNGQFHPLGTTTLGRGLHTIRVELDARALDPGSGAPDYGFGPLVIAPVSQPRNVTTVMARAARWMCGRTLDWIETLG